MKIFLVVLEFPFEANFFWEMNIEQEALIFAMRWRVNRILIGDLVRKIHYL